MLPPIDREFGNLQAAESKDNGKVAGEASSGAAGILLKVEIETGSVGASVIAISGAIQIVDAMNSPGETNTGRSYLRRRLVALAIGGALLVLVAVGLFNDSIRQNPPPPLPKSPFGNPHAVPKRSTPAARKTVQPAEANAERDAEQFGDAVQKQLTKFGKIFAAGEPVDEDSISEIVAEQFTGDRLRPATLSTAFDHGSVKVLRPNGAIGQAAPPAANARSDAVRSRAGLRDALRRLREPFTNKQQVRVKFKVFRVDLQPTGASTMVYFHSFGTGKRGSVQQNATWRCRWLRETGDAAPLLTQITLVDYEEVVRSGSAAMFADCTEAVLGKTRAYRQQLSFGIDHWRARLQAEFDIGLHGHEGIAVGDVNDDGLDDLYVCQPGGLPNRLFTQNRDGSATDVSAASGVDWLDTSHSALLVDLDNDGDQDLVIAMNVNVMILSNDGTGKFTERCTIYTRGDPYSLSAADFENDGDLDLYVCGYSAGFLEFSRSADTVAAAIPYPYHDANNGSPNMLLRNDGNWTFRDVTAECGLAANNRRWSFAAAWEDYDNDGDLDLYVANDYGRNNLYRNDGGRFVDVAAAAGVEDIAAGMSVAWADYDGDGWMDLYVGNMFSSAGGRIAYQRQFQPAAPDLVRRQFQRHARGNTLFRNTGDGTFHDVSENAAVTMGRWSWGSKFVDVNNDGREDLFVANGYITGPDTDDL